MTPETIRTVQQSLRAVVPISDLAADIFHDRLFAADPALRGLCLQDLGEQKRKLMKTLAMAVGALDRAETLLPMLRNLGARHAGYGVTAEHYANVGAALLGTLEVGLGDVLTPDVRSAWAEAYGLIDLAMQEGSAGGADAE